MLPLPDLLHRDPQLLIDRKALDEILGMAMLGRQVGTEFHDLLATSAAPEQSFNQAFFADHLFLETLVGTCKVLTIKQRQYPLNHRFLARTLGSVPLDPETTTLRQEVLRELDQQPKMLESFEGLYVQLFDLVSLHRTPSYQSNLDVAAFHLDILRQAKKVIDFMETAFAGSVSELKRLHVAGKGIQETPEYRTLASLLEYEDRLARLKLDVTIGADGSLRHFSVRDLEENEANRFYKSPFRRLRDRMKLLFNGYPMSNRDLMNRLINDVYRQLSPHFVPLIQLSGHLEFYLFARELRQVATEHGLQMTLAEFSDQPLKLEGLFNPLLLDGHHRPVPCRLELEQSYPITLITGPNSGGKTRLLQSLGLTQVLGQSGLYTPCSQARIRKQNGLFVSLVEDESATQTEGRLGRELMRVRSLFEEMAPGSMIILDELCSGTNPSEGIEVFEMVLRLISNIHPTAFVTTHFLDFARTLFEGHLDAELEFRQVEIDTEQSSTSQFTPGVATTSLASVTARRLGVTFEELSQLVEDNSQENDA